MHRTPRTPALSRLLPHRLRSTRRTTRTAALGSMACSRIATNTVGYRKCKRWSHNLSVSLGTGKNSSHLRHHLSITTSDDHRFPVTPRHLSLLPLCFIRLCLLYLLPSAASLLPNLPRLCQAGCYFQCCVCCVYKDALFFLILTQVSWFDPIMVYVILVLADIDSCLYLRLSSIYWEMCTLCD